MSQTVARVVFRSFISTGIVCNEYYFGDQNRGIPRATASIY